MKPNDYINELKPLLKSKGFKKSASTWRKFSDESICVFNIQKSQWDKDLFYINVGIYFTTLGKEPNPTEYKCHVRSRLEVTTPIKTFENAITWFNNRNTINKILNMHEDEIKKDLIHKDVRNTKIK